MIKISLERESNTPLYRQIIDQLREYIRSGVLASGQRLPTVRELAKELGLTRLTVQTAYAELQSEGLLEAVVGRGTFVAARSLSNVTVSRSNDASAPAIPWMSQGLLADMMRLSEQPHMLSFAQAIPAPETYPLDEFKRSVRAALDDPITMNYGPAQGEAILRQQIARLLLDRGIATTPDTVMITAGAQQGVDIVLRALTTSNDVILVEEPTYPGIIELAALRGQRLVGIPVDQDGLCIDALESACRQYRPRLLYTVATFHNPTGTSLSLERRQQLLQLAHDYNFLILEDDVYGFLAYDGPALPALKAAKEAENVLYLTSFSKVLMPGLRLGALVGPAHHLPALLAAKRSSDLICSPFLQRALADYLQRRNFGIHLQQVRALYRQRRDAMLDALAIYLAGCVWTQPGGGLSLWVSLPAAVNERDIYLEAIAHSIGVAPGSSFFTLPQKQAHLRLSFGAHAPSMIAQGIATLGTLLREHLDNQLFMAARAGRALEPLV